MRIVNNISALNVTNIKAKNTKALSKSIENLSSGLRINKAADDAAGLAISQKMRAQIRGLSQASRNAQDGISLIQTAEGGLAAIIDPHLQRLRELSLQASNDTLNVSDREKIQTEVNEIIGAIDNIANYTEFNTRKLLNIPYKGVVSEENVITVVEGSEMALTAGIRYDTAPSWGGNKIAFSADSNDIVIMNDVGGNEVTIANGISPSLSKDGNKVAFFKGDKLIVANNDGTNQVELANGLIVSSGVSPIYQSAPSWSSDSNALYFATNNGIEKIEISTMTRNVIVSGSNLKSPSISPSNDKIVYEKTDDSSIYICNIDGTNSQKIANGIEPVISPDGLKIAFSDSTNSSTSQPETSDIMIMNIDGSGLINVTETIITANQHWHNHHPTWSPDGLKIAFHTDLTNGDGGNIWSVTVGQSTSENITKIVAPDNIVNIQVGANAGNTFGVLLSDVRAVTLGISNLDLTTRVTAEKSIHKIDGAINTVVSEKSKYGAYQNALEHVIKNVDNAGEQFQAAESRITDLDMAKEVIKMTKFNILGQALDAMIAQANQLPQGVMQLLK